MRKLSVVLATYNEEKNLSSCLESIKGIADEIIIVDGKSSDKTVEIAKKFGARIKVTTNKPIFHINKQMAIDMATCDWILQLDADEHASKELKEEIKEILEKDPKEFNGYWIPRKNWFLGRFLKKGGQYPDYTLRLYRKGKGRLPQKDVHEQAEVNGKTGYLKSALLHYPYKNFSEYLKKWQRYTDLIASQIKEEQKNKNIFYKIFSAITLLILKPAYWFLVTYFRHKGIMDLWPGFIFSLFSALRFPVAYLKHLKQDKKNLPLLILGMGMIIYNIAASSMHLFLGDLMFHTDIARDFLLIQEMLNKGSAVLIGPRAGGIPGTFFGPFWLYINAPFYILGNGNPVLISYFWFFLVLLSISITFYVANKVFGWQVALISGAIYSFYTVNYAVGFTQTFGSVMLSPILFYLMFLFLQNKNFINLVLLLFLNGLIIQFQPAFGGITLLITSAISAWVILKDIKKIKYFLAFFVLAVPLFTYIIFEFRHNFLEIRSLINFLTNPSVGAQSIGGNKISFSDIISNRFLGFTGGINILRTGNIWHILSFTFINLFILYKSYFFPKEDKRRKFLLLFFIYYFSFWAITFLFKGLVWNFYYLGFIPIAAIIFSSLYIFTDKKVFYAIFLLLTIGIINSNKAHVDSIKVFSGTNSSSWITNEKIAKYIYADANNDSFGYYVFSPDEFGYSVKYALDYVQKQFPQKNANLCKKYTETYIIYNPTISENPDGDYFWKKKGVMIDSGHVEKKMIGEIRVEKYLLNEEQIKIQSDPNIVCDLHFR